LKSKKKSSVYLLIFLQIFILQSCSTVPEKTKKHEKEVKTEEIQEIVVKPPPPPPPTLEDLVMVMDLEDGRPYQISKLCGELPVFVEVSATWCEACKELYPVTEKLKKMFKGRVCFVRVMIDEKPYEDETDIKIVYPISSPKVLGLKMSKSLPRVVVLNKGEKEPYADLTGKYPFLYYYGLLSEL